MNISASYYSAIGGRENNEDAVSLLENNETVLGMVADGLGGHAGGEIASKLAINCINTRTSHKAVSEFELRKGIEEANEKILQDQSNSTMKTTIAAVWIDETNALLATVGDTRIYQFRDGKVNFQSIDHSVAQMAAMAGDISISEIRISKERHRLTRALGTQDEVEPDIRSLEIISGDAFLICSDGFWEKILEKEMIEDLLKSDSAGEWISLMRKRIENSVEEKEGDNHSAVAILLR